MACILKVDSKDTYLKSYTPVTGKVEFTDNPSEAKGYCNDWFANSEKKQLEFYAKLPVEDGGLDGDSAQIAEYIPALIPYWT